MLKYLQKRLKGKLLIIIAVLTVIIISTLSFSASKLYMKRRPKIFGATYMTMNNPYFTSLNNSIRNTVESHGDILLTRDPAQNQERQNQEIMDMIDEGMTVLFANAADSKAIAPAIKECKRRGVAVFVVDTKVDDNSDIISTIQSDNYEAGRLVALDLKKRYPDGARIMTLYHDSIASTKERLDGFLSVIEGDERYKVVMTVDNTSEIEVANREMNLILKNFRKFDVVFGNNDPSALGALAALDQYGLADGNILVYGVDGSPDAKAMIMSGKMAGTAAQYPMEMGRIAAETAYDYLDGKEVEKNITVKVTMMTKENLNENNSKGWQ